MPETNLPAVNTAVELESFRSGTDDGKELLEVVLILRQLGDEAYVREATLAYLRTRDRCAVVTLTEERAR